MAYESNQHLDYLLDSAALKGICNQAGASGMNPNDPATSERFAAVCARLAMRLAEDAGQDGPTFLREIAQAHEIALRLNHGVEF